MKVKLSSRAEKLLRLLQQGHWYPAYSKRIPKAMKELEDAGLVMTAGRVASTHLCYVPKKGFKPLRCERWDTNRE